MREAGSWQSQILTVVHHWSGRFGRTNPPLFDCARDSAERTHCSEQFQDSKNQVAQQRLALIERRV
jgi:hypothetical protein